MDYITVHMMRELKAAGFSFPEYEHELDNGMIFYYQEDEHFIGGSCRESFSEQDRQAAAFGEWLPDADALLEWLKNTHFGVEITLNADGNYSVEANDLQNSSQYRAESRKLSYALANVIRKICKSKKRLYIPDTTLTLSIMNETDS